MNRVAALLFAALAATTLNGMQRAPCCTAQPAWTGRRPAPRALAGGAVLRLAGATTARALGVVICKALSVTGTAILVAAAVAATTLLPLLHTAPGTWAPWAPAGYWVAGVLAVAALVLAGAVIPAALAMRTPAIEAVT